LPISPSKQSTQIFLTEVLLTTLTVTMDLNIL